MAIGKAIEDEIGNRRGNNQYKEKEDCQNFADPLLEKRKDEIASEKAGFNNKDIMKFVIQRVMRDFL